MNESMNEWTGVGSRPWLCLWAKAKVKKLMHFRSIFIFYNVDKFKNRFSCKIVSHETGKASMI